MRLVTYIDTDLRQETHWVKDISGKDFEGGEFVAYQLPRFKGGYFYRVTWVVIELTGGCVAGLGDTLAEAISCARDLVRGHGSVAGFLRRANQMRAESEARRVAAQPSNVVEAWFSRTSIKPKERLAVFEAGNGACAYCARQLSLSGEWHVDHKNPVCKGGKNEPSNYALACGPCNLRKAGKTADEFNRARGAA